MKRIPFEVAVPLINMIGSGNIFNKHEMIGSGNIIFNKHEIIKMSHRYLTCYWFNAVSL